MRHILIPALIACTPAVAQETPFPATLAGHALIPAATFVPAPADAPADARISGKFTGPVRNEVVGSVPGDTGPLHGKRPTGLSVPFDGQPLQGLSGYAMNRAPDGTIYSLTDNGFGSKGNSPDALLMFHRIAPDFATGAVMVAETVFLRDPDRKVPFRIAYEGTDGRYLTGADFDPESIQVVGERVFIGEEFGPYLIEATLTGTIVAVHATMLDGAVLKSVDAPGVSGTSVVGKDWTVPRSGGYEGMALQPGTGLLWGMLEKPLVGEGGTPEGNFLRVVAFDPAKGEWTGASFKFPLAEGATAIGDFNFIDETRALVIERDNGEGDPSLACAAGQAPPACFHNPARVKRVTLVDMGAVDAEGFVRKLGYIDLMSIRDPEGLARTQGDRAPGQPRDRFAFPFFTIENVAMVDADHIIVGNDNNLPFSAGRLLTRADDNEFILLRVPELLRAR